MSESSERETLPPDPGTVTEEAISAAFQVGAMLGGKYLITGVIGHGGIGVVLAATHQQLHQRVAIKHLKPTALKRTNVVERFLREARLAARVQSDHVARIYDVESTELGCPYIVMEYLEGTDLGDLLAAERKVPVDKAVDYVLQACEALAEAHALGIVHRDLKPENLFLAKRAGGATVLKILDFGISKLSETEPDSIRESKLTSDMETMGTPNYMSPELLQSARTVDGRTDIWALGVVFYELLSGRLPFDSPDLPQLCLAIVNAPVPPLRTLCPEVPRELDRIILKCLTKDREERYKNVGELAQDLAPFVKGASLARVEHVTQVMLESGEAVRVSARSGFATSAPPLEAIKRRMGGSFVLPAIAVAAGLLAILAFVARRPATPVSASGVAAPFAVSAASPQPEPAPPPPTPPETSSAAASPPATSSALAPEEKPAPRRPPPTPTVRAAAPKPMSEGAKKQAEFGDRQ